MEIYNIVGGYALGSKFEGKCTSYFVAKADDFEKELQSFILLENAEKAFHIWNNEGREAERDEVYIPYDLNSTMTENEAIQGIKKVFMNWSSEHMMGITERRLIQEILTEITGELVKAKCFLENWEGEFKYKELALKGGGIKQLKKYKISDIDDYMNRLTDKQKEKVIEHCNKYDIYPDICAWYDDMDDFYTDWIYDNKIFKTKDEADDRYEYGIDIGEFLKFEDGQIVRFSI